MREGIKTSLISILCAATATFAHAAPAVRTVGGTGTYDSAASAANATATNRAGSLRATGGYVRPSATSTSGATQKATTAATTTSTSSGTATAITSGTQKTTSSVATGGGTTGRVASTPRLSIGKYVGAPKSISTTNNSVSDLTQRVDKLETDVGALQTDKQDALKDSTYITVQGDELILDVEKIKSDLDLKDGREVEMGTNDDGLLWRYVGETEWGELISWEDLRGHLDLSEINTEINNQVTTLKNLFAADLDKKLDKDQGTDAAGRALVVGADGIVAATGDFADAAALNKKLDKHTDDETAHGKALVVDAAGDVVATGVFATPEDVARKLDAHTDSESARGKAMVVDTDGNIVPTGVFATPEEVARKLDAHIDDETAIGKTLVIDAGGNIVPGDIPTPNVYNKEQIDTMVENITNNTGITEEQLNAGLATRVAIDQGVGAKGMALVVNEAGQVEANGDFITETDLDNTLDLYELRTLGSLAWKNNVGTSEIQTKAITTEKLNTDAVTTDKIADKNVTIDKLSDAVVSDLGRIQAWETWWNENKPGEGDYVMSVQADGTRNWFRVVGADE